MAEVSGLPDPHEVMGKVKTVGFLSELGASLLGESMVIADNAYEIVPGWLPECGIVRTTEPIIAGIWSTPFGHCDTR